MKSGAVLTFVPCMILLFGSDAEPCVDSSRSSGDRNYFDHYRLVYSVGNQSGDVPPDLVDEVEGAMASWNDPNCNSGRHYPDGHGFPYFTTTEGGRRRDIALQYFSGFNPDKTNSCANFSGSTITMYEKADKPGGGFYYCTNSAIFEDIVAHELGHVLGFYDSGCAGYAMQDTGFTNTGGYVDRRVNASECETARDTHYTKSEEEGDQCAATGGPLCEDWTAADCEPCGGC